MKSTKAEKSEDLVSFLMAQQMEIAADYVRRGRLHRDLADAALGEAWKGAFQAYALDPIPDRRSAMYDLQAELDIRGIELPLAAVREDLDRLKALAELVAADPERLLDLDRGLREDLTEFKARRDRSKH